MRWNKSSRSSHVSVLRPQTSENYCYHNKINKQEWCFCSAEFPFVRRGITWLLRPLSHLYSTVLPKLFPYRTLVFPELRCCILWSFPVLQFFLQFYISMIILFRYLKILFIYSSRIWSKLSTIRYFTVFEVCMALSFRSSRKEEAQQHRGSYEMVSINHSACYTSKPNKSVPWKPSNQLQSFTELHRQLYLAHFDQLIRFQLIAPKFKEKAPTLVHLSLLQLFYSTCKTK